MSGIAVEIIPTARRDGVVFLHDVGIDDSLVLAPVSASSGPRAVRRPPQV
jgi:hypothetical protein